MAEETNVAAPSAAAEPKFTQFDGWDDEGTPVVTKKSEAPPKRAATAAADASKETVSGSEKTETAPATEAGKTTQETRRKPGAEARIGELSAENKRLKTELEEAKKPKTTQADSSPAKPAQTRAETPTRPKPTLQDKNPDGTPLYKSYEEFNEGVTDWKVEQRMAAYQAEQARGESSRRFTDAMSQAREAYADFDSVAEPMAAQVNELIADAKVDVTLKKALFDKDVVHILYALGKDPDIAEKFGKLARTDPAEAIFVWKSLKASVKKELAKAPAAAEGESKTPPASTKPRAPKPPSEVGGRGAAGEDALISAAKANDFRTFEAEQTRRVLALRR